MTKGSLVNYFSDKVPVSKVLANSRIVETVFISNGILILPAHIADRVNSRVIANLNLFKLGQFVAENLKSFLRAPAVEGLVFSLN